MNWKSRKEMIMQFEITREYIDHLRELIDKNLKEETRAFLKPLHPADIAEIMEHLNMDEDIKIEVLKEIEDFEQAGDIVDLLEYDEDTVVGVMAKELVAVNENWTVATCLKEISRQAAMASYWFTRRYFGCPDFGLTRK